MKKFLTLEGLEKLKKELEYLEKVKRKQVSERLNEAISQGDLRENAGYDAAKEEQGFVEGRIKELKEIIAQAEVIQKKQGDKVQIGSFVFLEPSGGQEKFQIVGPEEADILQGRISLNSPLGKALLNKKNGDVVKVSSPEGEKEYKIVKVQ